MARRMAGIDLHTHTVESDGTFTPSEVVNLARDRGLDAIAITDHDTTSGLGQAARAGEEAGVAVIPGIEFSAEYEGASLHVLAYWMDPLDPELQAELQRLRDTRFRRGELMVERLHALGYPISFERVREISGGTIARPHVAQAMVEAGIVSTEKEAFTEEFIADGGAAWVPKHALDPLDALDLIRAARGACVLAHPGMWKSQGSVPDQLIEAMADRGMAGLEVDHPDHDEAQRARYRSMARSLGLAVTGASDCHGTRYDPIRLGCCTTQPEELDALRRAAG
jgi:3',5'-nucleoside bisphosphate phosphatase